MSNYQGPESPSFGYEDDEGGDFIGYFQRGVNHVTPSGNKTIAGVILPSFVYGDDTIKPGSEEFKNSVAPYRTDPNDPHNIDDETKLPKMTSWFVRLPAYSWFGRDKIRFLSPRARKILRVPYEAPDLWDPIKDIRDVAYKSPTYKHLTQSPKNSKDKAVVPNAGYRCFYNTWSHDITKPANWDCQVVDMSSMAGSDLVRKLDAYRPANEEPRDPNWPNFLYGDITNPKSSIQFTTRIVFTETADFAGFTFVPGAHNTAVGTVLMPVTQDIVARRYPWDENTFKWYSYDEIVGWVVNEGLIPYELIMEACSGKCKIPEKPLSYSQASTTANTGTPAQGGQQNAPQGQFWVLDEASGQVEQSPAQASQIMQRLMSGAKLQLMPMDQSRPWGPAASFGFSTAPPPPPPPTTPPQGQAPPPPPPAQQQPAQQPWEAPGQTPSPQQPWTPPGQQQPAQQQPPWDPPGQQPDPQQGSQPAGSAAQSTAAPDQQQTTAPSQEPGSAQASEQAAPTSALQQGQKAPVSPEEETRYKELEAKGFDNLNDDEMAEYFAISERLSPS